MEVSIRPQNNIVTSLWRHFLSLCFQISIFVEHDIGYQASKFQCSRMFGSNYMEGDGKETPQCYNEIKTPSAYSV